MYNLTVLTIYFCIMLFLSKVINYVISSDIISIWMAYIVSVVYSYSFIKDVKLIPISAAIYFLLFSADWFFGYDLIATEKTDSFTLGIGASVVFIIPMIIGLSAHIIISLITKKRIT
ncbi:hypothetical protein CGJ25_24530 [Vibrio parahaemolyticus]|nr:hypothetical protein ACS91_02665 [Vibrio parahaemolyticus]OCP57282.1 hypothetical protein AKH04_11310 [Vibrio parahaemolyticus]PMT58810.1 hypothetical protein C1S87_24455 [Vibrio parahaemolyticus]PMT83939.1 hypothetical protein C1S83_24900 [Vibrio parahaemolyticus]PMT85478.1 hypothetical protein C1T03_24930 [Vibrio parahaemolyticus]